jgi:hypothetical protein
MNWTHLLTFVENVLITAEPDVQTFLMEELAKILSRVNASRAAAAPPGL